MIWRGCYDGSWKGLIVDEAFSHPAKVSFKLAERIYDHAIENQWIEKGQFVLDPFGGICGFGFHAMVHGLNFVGVELEQRFVDLGRQNIELWNHQLRNWSGLGTARIIQGDSRNLRAVIEGADIVISSPPYSTEVIRKRDIGKSNQGATRGNYSCDEYGSTPGNLANLKEGDVDLVVGSPPFSGVLDMKSGKELIAKVARKYGNNRARWKNGEQKNYGHTSGQLASLPEGRFDAVVGSPPYEKAITRERPSGDNKIMKEKIIHANYGKSNGQLGIESGPTFWQASREIVQGCHDLLKPGGVAIWVTKSYIKAGKRVDFPGRWLKLCESVGFKLVCEHRAMLVKHHGTQMTLDGEEEMTTERKSFFRRLYEAKGGPRIDWETIQCLRKEE